MIGSTPAFHLLTAKVCSPLSATAREIVCNQTEGSGVGVDVHRKWEGAG